MTRAGIGEYTEAVRGRYLRASKMEEDRILDEFTKVIGYFNYGNDLRSGTIIEGRPSG